MNGKKIIGIFLILTSLGFVGCGVRIGIDDNNNNRGELKDVDKDFKIDNVKNLNIAISAANVNVNLGDNDDLNINGKLCGGEENLVVRENGSDLSVEDKEFSDLSNQDINIDTSIFKNKDNNNFQNNKVNITIPKKYKENLNLTFGFGDIKIKDIEVKNLELRTGAGNIGINNIVFSSLDYKAGAGNLDMQLDKKCGSMDIKGGVGNIKIKLAEVGGNLDFKGGLGNTAISMPKNSPVRINTSNGLGQVNIKAETSGEGKYVFDLKSGVGNISVK